MGDLQYVSPWIVMSSALDLCELNWVTDFVMLDIAFLLFSIKYFLLNKETNVDNWIACCALPPSFKFSYTEW